MSVHFDPRSQPITSTQVQRPAFLVQKGHPFVDSLEVRSKDTGSWLDCFKNCFKAIWDFILGLFSKRSTKERPYEIEDTPEIQREIAQAHAQGMSVLTPAGHPEHFRKYFKDDRDYTGMPANDVADARLAEDLCAFPKLALYLSRGHEIGIPEACRRVNDAFGKDRSRTFLTPRYVARHCDVIQVPEPPRPLLTGDNNLYKNFKKNDVNYADLSQQDIQRIFVAEVGCEFPKLALCLVKEGGVDSMADAIRRVNEAHKQFPLLDQMSPIFVLKYSNATPTPGIGSDGVQPRAVPTPKPVNGGIFLNQEYTQFDFDYAGLSKEERQSIQAVEHDCSYPKLAMYLSKAFDLDLGEAAKRINAVEKKHPQRKTLTPMFVMQWY